MLTVTEASSVIEECKILGCRKTRGLGAGRKLKNHRRAQLWADKDYKKSHLGNEWKKPFAGASHAKGIVLEKMYAFPLSQARPEFASVRRITLIPSSRHLRVR